MLRALIVDDSPTEIHIFRKMLEQNGIKTSVAMTGEDGIALAKEERPDVVLMDVYMPGISGFQATRILSSDPLTAHIPVIIVSTKNQESDKTWGLRQGAKKYIGKPVEASALIDAIHSVVSHAQHIYADSVSDFIFT